MSDKMKTDRELLELAAKAAKMNTREFATDSITRWHWREDGTHTAWNPLTDDGDALRLAVKLNLSILPDAETETIRTVEAIANTGGEFEPFGIVKIENDQCAATRRAITRAAAAIGEGMK